MSGGGAAVAAAGTHHALQPNLPVLMPPPSPALATPLPTRSPRLPARLPLRPPGARLKGDTPEDITYPLLCNQRQCYCAQRVTVARRPDPAVEGLPGVLLVAAAQAGPARVTARFVKAAVTLRPPGLLLLPLAL